MLLQESCPRIRDPDPRSFAGLMEMYEWNYINMRRLCGDLEKLQQSKVSTVLNGLDLHIGLLERNKYTTTIVLTYYFKEDSDCKNEPSVFPNVHIRIYHDARQAEVLKISDQIEWPALNTNQPGKQELRERWKNNRFLFKWLTYCLQQGHLFLDGSIKASGRK